MNHLWHIPVLYVTKFPIIFFRKYDVFCMISKPFQILNIMTVLDKELNLQAGTILQILRQ